MLTARSTQFVTLEAFQHYRATLLGCFQHDKLGEKTKATTIYAICHSGKVTTISSNFSGMLTTFSTQFVTLEASLQNRATLLGCFQHDKLREKIKGSTLYLVCHAKRLNKIEQHYWDALSMTN